MNAVQLLHTALLYEDPDDLVTGAVPFIRDGLAAGEPVLVAVPEPNLTRLRAALGSAANGVRFVDMARAGRNPAAIIPWVLHPFLAEHAGGHARIVGEPVWPGRTSVEYPVCVQHEALINVVLAGQSATILCPYDVGALPPDVIADAVCTHPLLGTGISAAYADPYTVVSAFNQPLPPPPPSAATLTFHTDDLREVRAFVLKHADLPAEQLIDLEMAVNELATNAVAHTPGPGTIRIWTEPGTIICDISDPGPFTNELAGRIPPSPSSGRGRGLLLANHVCDLVRRYSGDEGTTIRLQVRRP